MQKLNKSRIWGGFALAGLLYAALFILPGFQSGAEKTAVVDMNQIIQGSNLGKANTDRLNKAVASRRGLIEFVATFKVLTLEQAQSLRSLELKETMTETDKQQADKIKADVRAADQKFWELSQKSNPTEADRQLIQEYANRSATMNQTLERWNQEFTDELTDLQDRLRQQTLEKAKAAVDEVAKKQGISVVFEKTFAVYGANDLTDAATKAMNAKP